MKPRVVCVSRSLAAGGQHIARTISQKMGFRYVDEEIIREVAEREKVDVSVIEDAERRQSFLVRLLDSLAVSPAPEMMAYSPGFFPLTPADIDPGANVSVTERRRQLIREVVKETAQAGNVVIFAHAAAFGLGGGDDKLRVLVTASPQTRAERLAAAYDLSAAEAEKQIAESDKARRDYLRDFYEVAQELPTHYDLVINTDVLSPRAGVEMIMAVSID